MPQLSVLHVVLSLDPGGLERVVIDLAREAPSVSQRASILCIERSGELARQAEAVTKIHCASKGPGLRWSVVDKIRSILREVRPDIVHTHQAGALFYLTAISRGLMPVLAHTEHSNRFRLCLTVRERLTYFSILALAGPRTDRIFTVSEDARRSILRAHVISQRKLFTVPNGINFDRFQQDVSPDPTLRQTLGIPAGSFVLGNIGRLSETKRLDILISAFATLSTEFPASHLLLVGDGPSLPELQNQAVKLGIANRVHFTGFQPNPELYLRMVDVFVLTSRIEGMPLAVLEAAASGVPVIASRVGGLEEMSNDGRSILLYEFNDSDTLLFRLRRLIIDGAFRKELADAGREHVVATYSAARMARDYNKHYAQLIEHRAR